MFKINSLLFNAHKILAETPTKTPKLDAEILLSSVLNKDLKEIIFDKKLNLNQSKINIFKELIRRRKNGEPIAYILKKKEFWKYNFYVDCNVLIPRPDTEIIVEETLKVLNNNKKNFVLDVGTGSGCIIISLANDCPNLMGTAIDISKKALKVAKINAKMHQLLNRIKFYNSSVDNFFKGKYDLIVSNPPYINNKSLKYLDEGIFKYEPNVALEGGDDGLSLITKVILKSSKLLKKGGKLVLEIGFDQKYKVIRLLKSEKYYVNKIIYDYAKNPRCVISTKL